MKSILKQTILTLSALLLAAASGSAQVLSPLYNFDNNTNDGNRVAGLLLSSDTLYGTASGGAASGGRKGDPDMSGAVFKLNTDGIGFTNLYIFSPVAISGTNTDGANPAAPLVLSGNRLYGTTRAGGFYGDGFNAHGTVFAVNTDGTGFTNLHNFGATVQGSGGFLTNTDGANPAAGLILSGDTLYGTTGAGRSGNGTVFAIHTDGTGFTNLYSFNPANGDGAGLKTLLLSDNTLYGTTSSGGDAGNGTVFALNTDGTGFTNLHSFSAFVEDLSGNRTNSDGAAPQAALVLSGNRLFGTAASGGLGSSGLRGGRIAAGTVFAVNTDGTGFTNLHSFNGSDGTSPSGGLAVSGSTLYGTASSGGGLPQQNGTVFALKTDGTGFATLHTFTFNSSNPSGPATNADGSIPYGNVIISGSTLYGTTKVGGANGFGTVFALDLTVAAPTIQFTVNPTNGVPPMALQFNSPAVDSGGDTILAWNWNFGDGSSSILQNPSHTYTNAGTFFPTLTCINNNGSTVTGSGPAITAAYPRSILNGGFETGTFTNWTRPFDFSAVSIDSKYVHSGKYGAGLETGGTMGFLSQIISTTPGAVYLISFWFDSPRDYVSTNDFQVSWNGNVLLEQTDLAAIGWTNIQLTVTATTNISTLQFGYLNGYFFFGLDDVSVSLAALQIQFTATSTNGPSPLAVQFNAPAIDGGGNTILAWNWNFGDGSNSTAQNPSHTYTNVGTFFPTLTCINNDGSTVLGSGPAITAEYSRSILNSGFETATFADWTLSGQAKYILPVATLGTAHSGTYGAALQTKGRGAMGFLSQTISTTPGELYLISFSLDNPRIYNTTNDFQVSWNGNVLLDEADLTNIGWTNIQLTVAATATSTTLQFGYLNDYFPFGLDDISVAPAQPALVIGGISVSGTDLILSGINGPSNRTYYLLMSTNVAQPLTQWTPVATNVLDANGNFTITAPNAVEPNTPERFYSLQLQ